jgi:hypothetical protein
MKQIPRFGYIKPPKYNLELELQVLQHKQSTYNRNYKHLQNLKAEALNIQFINKEAKGKIDSFNEEISNNFDTLNGDFGDLSDNNLAQRYNQMFTKFQDEDLVSLYKKESTYDATLKDINKRKKAKKPGEAGYHIMNEMVYRLDLEKYSKLSLEDARNATVDSYVPYVDIGKMQQEALLKIPEIETEWEETDSATGQKTITKLKGRDQKAAAQISQQINRDNYAQYKVQAKYLYASGALESPEVLQGQLTQYNNSILGQRQALDNQREKLNLSYKDKKKDDEYYTRNQQIENKKAALKTYNLEDLDEDQMIGIISNNLSSEVIQGSVRAFAPQSKSVTTELDSVYKFGREFALASAKFQHQQDQDEISNTLAKAELQLKGLKIAQDGKIVSATGKTGDFIGAVPTTEATSVFTPDQIKNYTDALASEAINIIIANHDFDKGGLKLEGTTYAKKLEEKRQELYLKRKDRKFSNTVVAGTSGTTIRKTDAEDIRLLEEIKKIDALIEAPLTKERVLESLQKNPSIFDNDPVLSNNADILAYKEAIADLQRGGSRKTLLPEDIEKEAQKIKEDPQSDYSLQKQKLERYYAVFEKELGAIDINDEYLDSRIKEMFNNPNTRHHLFTGETVDLQGTTDKDKLNQATAKNLLTNSLVQGEATTLNIGGLKPSDLAQVQYHENGQTTIVFDDTFIQKAKKADRPLIVEVKNREGIPVPVNISESGQVTFFNKKSYILDDYLKSIDSLDSTKEHIVGDYKYTVNEPIHGRIKVHITRPDGSTFIERVDANANSKSLQEDITNLISFDKAYGGTNQSK